MNTVPFSRKTHCRITDAVKYCGLNTVILENECLRAVIFPEKGAEIYSIQYKPLDIDPLLHFRALQTPPPFPATIPSSDGAFTDMYDGGWQVMFPSGGGTNSVLGAEFGRHGEAALLPWSWKIMVDEPEKVSVYFWTKMSRTPFLYEREVSLLAGESKLIFTEKITNHGGVSLPFMWGHHPAFGAPFLDGSCVLDTPADKVESVIEENPSARVPAGIKGSWPIVKDKNSHQLDLRFIPENGVHTSDMLFLSGMQEGWYALTNRNLQFGFALMWDVDVFPVLWVWQEFGGSKNYPWYANTYALGLEPCTSYATAGINGLAGIVESGQARTLKPGESLSVHMQAILFEALESDGVEKVNQNGRVELRKQMK